MPEPTKNVAKFSTWATTTNTIDIPIPHLEVELISAVAWPHVSSGVKGGLMAIEFRRYKRATTDKTLTVDFPIAREQRANVSYPAKNDKRHILQGPGFIRATTVKTENHQIYLYVEYRILRRK